MSLADSGELFHAGGHEEAINVGDLEDRFLAKEKELEVDKYFRACVKLQGSDLHMKVGQPPIVRVHGKLKQLNRGPIDMEEMCRLLFPMMNKRHRAIFDKQGGTDFAYTVNVDGEIWRFRVNMLTQMGRIGLVARRVSNFIPDFAGLHLPPIMEELCKYDQGMVLLAGVTGSGKTTTIASMLNWVNAHYSKHILTLEDPIEFVYTENKCLINQREVGEDVIDFGVGMKHAVREDPDVMLVGEMRDQETFMTAIHAAETGHLVFGTIHAVVRADDHRAHSGPIPGGTARCDSQRDRLQHAGHCGPETAALDQAGGRAGADGRDHDVHADRPQAGFGRAGRQAARRDPDWRRRGNAGLHDEPEATGG